MKKTRLLVYLFFAMTIQLSPAYAYKDKSIYFGGGYYSQNAINRVAAKDDGSTSLLGTTSYLLAVKYDSQWSSHLFFSPQLSTTVVARRSADNSATVSMTSLVLPVGGAIVSGGEWDWSAGPGVIFYEIKGSGGTKQLNNGTGTATFAVPGRKVSIRTVTLNGGVAYNKMGRWGFDLVIEGALSSGKRTESFMLSYLYPIGG